MVRMWIHHVPSTTAPTIKAGVTTNGNQWGTSSNTLGSGKAITTSRNVSAIPITFTVRMNTVRMIWIRSRRRAALSETPPRSNDPYAGVLASRPLW